MSYTATLQVLVTWLVHKCTHVWMCAYALQAWGNGNFIWYKISHVKQHTAYMCDHKSTHVYVCEHTPACATLHTRTHRYTQLMHVNTHTRTYACLHAHKHALMHDSPNKLEFAFSKPLQDFFFFLRNSKIQNPDPGES